jgi:2-dehydropantoate 2-reductase
VSPSSGSRSARRRIAVVGTGANGASIAADLTEAGEDVVLIEQWPAHVEAMRANGLIINMPERTLSVPVRAFHLCDVATLRQKFDVVLLLVKAYDTRWAAHLLAPYLEPDGVMVGVQNGLTTSAVAEVVGADRTVGAVIEITSAMTVPGIVERHSGPGRSWFAVGRVDPADSNHEQTVASVLRHSGSVEIVADIEAAKWMKLVSNATTLVTSAILGQSIADATKLPEMRDLMLRSGQEALDAAIGVGTPFVPIFGLTESDVTRPETIVEKLLNTLLEGFVLPHSMSTVLQDWAKGRRSEVDEINGHVTRTGQKLGSHTPANSAVVELAHAIESGDLHPAPANLALLLERSSTAKTLSNGAPRYARRR